MELIYKIEDSMHAEFLEGTFTSYNNALLQLQKIALIPFDKQPNKPPCSNWKDCERLYEIIEYDNSKIPWEEISRKEILSITSKGFTWKNQ